LAETNLQQPPIEKLRVVTQDLSEPGCEHFGNGRDVDMVVTGIERP
jgi:hypothetical protein